MRVRGPMLDELCKRIQHCCATLQRSRNKRKVGSCWLRSLIGFKLCATTPNNTQQHATGCEKDANMEHPTMLGIVEQQCCIRLHGLCTLDFFYNKKKMLRKVTVLGLWCACSAVLRAKRVCVCVKTNMPEIVVFTVPSTCLYTVVPRYHEPLVKSRFHCITP